MALFHIPQEPDLRVEEGEQTTGVALYVNGGRIGRVATIPANVGDARELATLLAAAPAMFQTLNTIRDLSHDQGWQGEIRSRLNAAIRLATHGAGSL